MNANVKEVKEIRLDHQGKLCESSDFQNLKDIVLILAIKPLLIVCRNSYVVFPFLFLPVEYWLCGHSEVSNPLCSFLQGGLLN